MCSPVFSKHQWLMMCLQRSKVKDFAVAKLVGSRRGAEDDESKGEDKKEKAKAAKDDKK